MLVRLSVSFLPGRAHLASALLEAHGVRCFVWHTHSVHIYAPGAVFGHALMVESEDYDEAMEILQAPPGEVTVSDEPGENEVPKGWSYLPNFFAVLAWWILLITVMTLGFGVMSRLRQKLGPPTFGPQHWEAVSLPEMGLLVCLAGAVTWLSLKSLKRVRGDSFRERVFCCFSPLLAIFASALIYHLFLATGNAG